MAHITANRVSEFTQSSGIGPIVLSAARGYLRFNAKMSVGDTCWYSIEWFSPVTGEALAFEHGTATYTSLDTLTRTSVQESSSGVGVRHAFPTGKKRVSLTILAPDQETSEQWRDILGIASDPGTGDPAVIDAMGIDVAYSVGLAVTAYLDALAFTSGGQ